MYCLSHMPAIPFICPSCRPEVPLVERDGQLQCSACQQTWSSHDGIWSFTPDVYWGEVPEERVQQLFSAIQKDGFAPALATIQQEDPDRYRFFMDPARSDWRFAMDLHPTDHVLDVGCGMGGNTFGLCDHVEHVTAFDLSHTRTVFTDIRRRELGKTNITILNADITALPFPDASFDVIVFNGILEWVGQNMKFDDPYKVQQWVMQICFRLLKPGGRMYVGIENRWYPGYLTGPDHIGLPVVAWMPRWLARPYCRWRIGKDYRTYVHGKRGYEKIFRDAGFEQVRVWMPYPGYNDQRLLIPFDDIGAFRYALTTLMGQSSWKKRLLARLGSIPFVLRIYRYFFFSYNIYGTKPRATV